VIRKRRNGLQVPVYAGRDPLTGHKRWVSRQVPGHTKQSYRQAKEVEAELLEQVDRGQHRGSSSRTVAELIERWLSWRQQVRPISPVTVANYRGAIDRYILPNLGRAKVQQVDASTIDALYEHVRARGGKELDWSYARLIAELRRQAAIDGSSSPRPRALFGSLADGSTTITSPTTSTVTYVVGRPEGIASSCSAMRRPSPSSPRGPTQGLPRS
jgi:hypothetical protein